MSYLDDLELIEPLQNLFVGQLSDEEMQAFLRLERQGYAYRDYSEPAALFFGISKIRIKDNPD